MSDMNDPDVWESEEDGGSAPQILSQAEIDSLLGNDIKRVGDENRSGLQRIISSGVVSYERLPMLEVVVDRLVRLLSTSLRNLMSDNVEVSTAGFKSVRFGDYLDEVPLPTMMAVFKAEQWDNYGLIVADTAMIYSAVDVLLGGRRGTAPLRVDGRPFTSIERVLVEKLVRVVLQDMSASFKPLSPIDFTFNRMETNPRFAAVCRPTNACILVSLRIEMDDRGGRIELLLPYATLEPVRDLLIQQFMGEKFGRDTTWERHLAEEVKSTEIDLSVVLGEQFMRLADVARLRIGDSIILDAQPGGPVEVRCGTIPLFEGHLGRRKDKVAVRLDTDLQQRGMIAVEKAAALTQHLGNTDA